LPSDPAQLEQILEAGRRARVQELAAINPKLREAIVAGSPRQEALRIYQATLNQPDTLFAIDDLLPQRLKQMRERLHDPITADEACALNDVLYRRRTFTDMIAWLRDEPVSWDGFAAREKFRDEEDDRQLEEYLKQQDELWAKGLVRTGPKLSQEELAEYAREYIASAEAHSCPRCGTLPEHQEWYVYSDPPSCWRHSGSGVASRCKFCRLEEVNFFIGILSRGKRPIEPARRISREVAAEVLDALDALRERRRAEGGPDIPAAARG
jgi:hypothetical protein